MLPKLLRRTPGAPIPAGFSRAGYLAGLSAVLKVLWTSDATGACQSSVDTRQ